MTKQSVWTETKLL